MKFKIAKFIVILISVGLSVQAQQATTAAGGDATGGGGSVTFSVGQVVYTTNTGANGSVAEGVQQPYEIFSDGIKETTMNISLTAFPNPTIKDLTLTVAGFSNEKLNYQLLDMHGKTLESKAITAKETQISMSNLSPATYFIQIDLEGKKIQAFKIVKN